jgi:hypothetical protein
MNRTLLIAAGLALSVAGAAPAVARCAGNDCSRDPSTSDYYYDYNNNYYQGNPQDQRWSQGNRHRMVEPDQLRSELRDQKFRHIGNFNLDGNVYRCAAIDSHGHKVQVALDAWTGRIVDVKRR